MGRFFITVLERIRPERYFPGSESATKSDDVICLREAIPVSNAFGRM
ncbi:MAG: hypothetical protein V3S97_11550 [Candidatus Bathyarchaeia archaeon]